MEKIIFEDLLKEHFNDDYKAMLDWLNINAVNKKVNFMESRFNILDNDGKSWIVDRYTSCGSKDYVYVDMTNGQGGNAMGLVFLEDDIMSELQNMNKPTRTRWYSGGKLEKMSYIKKYDQINEELKRRLTPEKLRQQKEDEEKELQEKRSIDVFSIEELKILKKEDFEIDTTEKIATSKDKHFTYTIKKSLDITDEVVYNLAIKNNKSGEITYERKIKGIKRSQQKDTLDFLIDKCAYILHSAIEKKMKEIDPYDEESWDEEEKSDILTGKKIKKPPYPKNIPNPWDWKIWTRYRGF